MTDTGRALEEASGIAAVIDPDGDHILLVPKDILRIHQILPWRVPFAFISSFLLWHSAGLSDQFAVEISLVTVVDGPESKLHLFRKSGAVLYRRGNRHMDPVPGVGIIVGDPLIVPGLIQREGLPGAVVKARSFPFCGVPDAEFRVFYNHVLGVGRECQPNQ